MSDGRGLLSRNGRSLESGTRGQSLTCARRDLNRTRPTLVMPELASLSVKSAPVDSRLIQLERGTCHTLWHRLDLDFVFD